MALPDPVVSIALAKINDAVMYTKDDKDDVYVMTIVDTSKSIFKGMQISTKTLYTFKTSDKVHIIVSPDLPYPKLGQELLKV